MRSGCFADFAARGERGAQALENGPTCYVLFHVLILFRRSDFQVELTFMLREWIGKVIYF